MHDNMQVTRHLQAFLREPDRDYFLVKRGAKAGIHPLGEL